jgi:hypothetical protein
MSNKSGTTSSAVISLPKGGGALHGIGEKFSPDGCTAARCGLAVRSVGQYHGHPGEKLATRSGKRHPGAPVNRCASGNLEALASGLSWVRRELHAQCFGEGGGHATPSFPNQLASRAPAHPRVRVSWALRDRNLCGCRLMRYGAA